MGSKGRHQPYQRQAQPPMPNPDSFIPGRRPFFDMPPPPDIMEQKLVIQHSEMQKLAHENQRLASSHAILRQDLAATQQELHRLQAQIGLMKSEKEQRMKGLQDKIAAMEVDMRPADAIKAELQQARVQAQTLLSVREELVSRAQQLTLQLQHSHAELQQLPPLVTELDGLRREYHNFRLAYEYERKLHSDHLESLQVMEKNYVSMLREVEKLRNELANYSTDRRAGQYGTNVMYQEVEARGSIAPSQAAPAQLPADQNARENVYNVYQGRAPPGGAAAGQARANYEVPGAGNYNPSQGGGGGSGGYDASRASAYEVGARGAVAGYEAAAARAATMYSGAPGLVPLSADAATAMYSRNPIGAQAAAFSAPTSATTAPGYQAMAQAPARPGGPG